MLGKMENHIFKVLKMFKPSLFISIFAFKIKMNSGKYNKFNIDLEGS